MNGAEIERLLTLLDGNASRNRDEILNYVQEHRDGILADLERCGESVIPNSDGDIVLRKACQG